MSDGMGCRCGAHGAWECGCGVDWTPQETIILKMKLADAEKELSAHKESTLDGDCPACDYQAFTRKIKELENTIKEERETSSRKIAELKEVQRKSLEGWKKTAELNELDAVRLRKRVEELERSNHGV